MFKKGLYLNTHQGLPDGSVVENLPGNTGDETRVPSLAWEGPICVEHWSLSTTSEPVL